MQVPSRVLRLFFLSLVAERARASARHRDAPWDADADAIHLQESCAVKVSRYQILARLSLCIFGCGISPAHQRRLEPATRERANRLPFITHHLQRCKRRIFGKVAQEDRAERDREVDLRIAE
jgi:hypothetical protein